MTHGQMTVRTGADGHPIHLYTWHDGHHDEALRNVLGLAPRIFQTAALAWSDDKLRELRRGLHFYDLFTNKRNRSYYDTPVRVLEMYESLVPLQSCDIGIANWLCWQTFNKWHVVPDLSWVAYPSANPDLLIEVTEGRLVSYTVFFPCWIDWMKDEEKFGCAGELESDFRNIADQINKSFTQGAQIRASRGERGLEFHVPFDVMIVDLLWQEIQTKNKIACVTGGNLNDENLHQVPDAP